MNIQPRDMYWSVLGMMNNPWFRIEIIKDFDNKTVRFEHPTQLNLNNGWMEQAKKAGANLLDGFWGKGDAKSDSAPIVSSPEPEIKMTKEGVNNVIEYEEFVDEKEGKCLFVVDGEVFDGTAFFEGHPGGMSDQTPNLIQILTAL